MQELAETNSPVGAAETLEWSVIRRITWRSVPLLVPGYIFSMIGRVNAGFAAITAWHDEQS